VSAGLTDRQRYRDGRATVSAVTVIDPAMPTLAEATANVPVPEVPGIVTMPSALDVAVSAITSGVGVAEAESSSVLMPVRTPGRAGIRTTERELDVRGVDGRGRSETEHEALGGAGYDVHRGIRRSRRGVGRGIRRLVAECGGYIAVQADRAAGANRRSGVDHRCENGERRSDLHGTTGRQRGTRQYRTQDRS